MNIKKTRKKICFVVTSPLIVEFFLRPHLKALAEFSDVTLLVSSIEDGYVDLADIPVNIFHIPIYRKINIIADIVALWAIIRHLSKQHYDLVQTVAPKAGLLGMLAACICAVETRVHYFQGEVWSNRHGFSRCLLKFCDRLTAMFATHVLAVSKSEREFLLCQKVTRRQPASVLASGSICGVDLSIYKPSYQLRLEMRQRHDIRSDDWVCLFAGRICRDKGVLDLAKAWMSTRQSAPSLHLVLVGPDEDNLTSELQQICLGAHDYLHIHGYQSNLQSYYALSDFLCLPSYREGLGMVILEAAAIGIPSIGSSIDGISDAIVQNVTGLSFQPGNIEELKDCILKLVNHSDLRVQLGNNARSRVRREFDQKNVIAAYVAYVKNVLRLEA